MGDSVTYRWDLSDYTSLPTENFGVDSDTTAEMLARFHNQVVNSDPAVVVILGGSTDLRLYGATGTNTDAIRAMVQDAADAGIKVILCSVLPTTYPTMTNAEIESFNQEIIDIAKENGDLYADYYDVMINADGTTNTSLYVDQLHPNSAGYKRMWAVVAPLIEEDLNGGD